VSRIVTRSLELDEVYDGFVEELRGLLPVDRTSVVELDPDRIHWRILRQWTRQPASVTSGVWRPLDRSFVGHVVSTGEPLLETNLDPNGRWAETPSLRAEGMRSRIVVPLIVHDLVIGTVSVASCEEAAFTDVDVQILAPMAAQLASAIDNIRLYGEVKDYASTLERRVAERTAELEAFSYSVSHDLRAPLRAIDGFSRILQEDHGAALDEQAHRYLTLVRGGTQRMGRLIDDLLAFSRLGRQELVRRPVRMADLARQALEELKEERAGRQLDVTIDDLPEAFADPGLLRQVFANLLSNALKFTRVRTPARIHVGSTRENGETVFFVEDNGVGFDMAFVGKLFGVFQRLHRQEDYEGTGVGLAIVKQVVRRHGGRVWAEGAVDQGATFFFVLPEGNEP
jgi:signal transduction histidine kinase